MINDKTPHIAMVDLKGNAHVIPKEVFTKIVSGEMKLTDLTDWEIITRSIFHHWLVSLDIDKQAAIARKRKKNTCKHETLT